MGVTEALGEFWQQDFLQSSFCQLVAAVAAPHVHHHHVAIRTRRSCICAAGAQAVGRQVTNLSKKTKNRNLKISFKQYTVSKGHCLGLKRLLPPQTGREQPERDDRDHRRPFLAPEY